MWFGRDLRYALRALAKSPGYSLSCVLVLALGIGANTAIFSIVSSVVLKPLPYPEVSRLAFVWQRFPHMPDPPGGRLPVARKNYEEWKRRNTVFEQMAAFRENHLIEKTGERPAVVSTGFASSEMFPMLGARPRLGRLFTTGNERPGYDRVAVVTDAYFERTFHRSPSALGSSITLKDVAYTVIGVLPPKFHLPATSEGMDQLKPEVWIPLSRLWSTADDDTQRQLLVMARLRPSVSVSQARAEMEAIAAQLAREDPKLDEGWTTSVYPFEVEDTGPTLHRALLILQTAVLFLLLIACANLANLSLVRAALRSRDIAVRLALGASRTRIVTELLSESILLCIAGTGAGLLLAHWAIQLMLALKPPDIQRPELIEIDPAAFVFAGAAAVFTTLMFGLIPALLAAPGDLQAALNTGGGWGASPSRSRARQILIAAEVSLALVLLSGAGLMVRSFRHLVSTGIGFETAHLVGADIDLPDKRYPSGEAQSRFWRALIDRARVLPGVYGAALVDNLPLHSVGINDFLIAGRPDPPVKAPLVTDSASISPEYFRLLGLRLLAGRFFTQADLTATPVIVNQTFARKFFSGDSPLGNTLLSGDRKRTSQIVGVVSDYRPMGVENGARPQIFRPSLRVNFASLIVRTGASPKSVEGLLRDTVHQVDPELAVDQVRSMDEYLDGWQAQRRFNTLLLAILAGLALVLALIGLYGVLSNLVMARVREIGIRVAIGARPSEIAKLVIRQSVVPVVSGVIIGLAGTLMLSRFLGSLLFQVDPRDPLTLAEAACALILVSPVAVYLPLRRALSVDCAVALRNE